jgi:NAD(P)-dependent dehydrogenase (short-subunit alcohol dehydrogenase family)
MVRDLDAFQEEILFNTVVPIRLTRAFLPLIKKSKEKKVIFVTSALGSFERTWPLVNECNAYSVSKAALNMSVHFISSVIVSILIFHEGCHASGVHP